MPWAHLTPSFASGGAATVPGSNSLRIRTTSARTSAFWQTWMANRKAVLEEVTIRQVFARLFDERRCRHVQPGDLATVQILNPPVATKTELATGASATSIEKRVALRQTGSVATAMAIPVMKALMQQNSKMSSTLVMTLPCKN